MIISGIDPGKTGYCVVVDDQTNKSWKHQFKFDAQGLLNEIEFKKFFSICNPDLIILEKVHGRDGWGAQQTFSMGMAFGQIHMAVRNMKIPYRLVSPVIWQKKIFEGITEKLKPKVKADIAYKQLFPTDPVPNKRNSEKKNDNLVDALLIASFGVFTYGNGFVRPWVFRTEKRVQPVSNRLNPGAD